MDNLQRNFYTPGRVFGFSSLRPSGRAPSVDGHYMPKLTAKSMKNPKKKKKQPQRRIGRR